jgi:hypothetical protein
MRPRMVVVVDIGPHYPVQVALIEDQDLV